MMQKMMEKLAERIGDLVFQRFYDKLNKLSSNRTSSEHITVADFIKQLKTMPPNATVKIAKGAFIVGNYTHMENKDVILDIATDEREPSVILYPDWYSAGLSKGVDY